ncbi:uncharacterized protein LOC126370210 isoform X2 [Pectinophora gossypiella]|nr:uncharacterized protein LOC126370210 isoform X2 [Pectinophora gossypiella]
MSLLAVSVAVAGVTCGLMLYRQYLRTATMRRYQGFCSIPIQPDLIQSGQLIEPRYREHAVMPLQWSSEPDVQIFSVDNGANAADVAGALREEFDVNARVETIRVYDNGRTISFMHDFDDNVTGIIDNDRCFVMDLDPMLVLTPDMLVFGIEHGDEFDVSRVHSTVRAVLPALEELARQARMLVERCYGKPTYRLQKEPASVIRKRSIDGLPHDYIHFAGKHIQEIEISNLADLLEYEQEKAAAQ